MVCAAPPAPDFDAAYRAVADEELADQDVSGDAQTGLAADWVQERE